MTLKQSISDKRAAAAKNDEVLQHWQREHDKLHLVDVEYVLDCESKTRSITNSVL